MHIGIDVDDVLAQLCNPVIAYANERYKAQHTMAAIREPKLELYYGLSIEEVDDLFISFFQHHTESLPIVQGALDAIALFKARGDCMTIITSRYAIAFDTTCRWLRRHFGDVFDDIVFTHLDYRTHGIELDKGEICRDRNIDVMIEDRGSNALACASQEVPAFLLHYPWNQYCEKREDIKNDPLVTVVGDWRNGVHDGWQDIIAWRNSLKD